MPQRAKVKETSIRALVVDDDPHTRRLIIRTLGTIGIRDTVEAGTGTQAVKAAQQGVFDVVLLDWNMPELSGLDVLRLIRGSDRPSRVIMVTAETDKARILEAMESGVDDYLIKPFKPDQLVKKVKRVVPGAG